MSSRDSRKPDQNGQQSGAARRAASQPAWRVFTRTPHINDYTKFVFWRLQPLRWRLAAGVLIVLAAMGIRFLFLGPVETRLAYHTFFPAVALAGLFGGTAAGALAAILSALIAGLWIDPPNEQMDVIAFCLFLAGSSVIVVSAETAGQANAYRKMVDTLEGMTNAFFSVDGDFIVTYVNRASEKIIGRGRKDLLGKSVWVCIPAAANSGFRRRCEQVLSSGQPIDCEEFNAALERWFAVNIRPSDGGLAVYFHDITNRKRSETLLRESEERLRLALAAARIGTWEWNRATRQATWDQRNREMFGFAPDEAASSDTFLAHVHPDDREKIKFGMAEAFRNRSDYQADFRIVRKDGTMRWLTSRGGVSMYPQDKPSRMIGVNFDVTESKLIEAALRESEATFRTLAEAVPQIVWATRADGWNTYFNQKWVDYTGLTLEESYGHGWITPVHPDDNQRAWDAWHHATQNQEIYTLECRLRRADGVYRWWLIRGAPVFDANGEVHKWFGTCTDIDDIKKAEARQALLIRELDHRVKNILSRMSVVIARSRAGNNSIDEFLDAVEGRIHSMSATHSRLSRNQWKGVGLDALVKDELEPYLTASNTEVKGPDIKLGPDAAQVIAMVLHELATNAAKYGALSCANGRVLVSWEQREQAAAAVLALTWRETDGPPVQPPARTSYGTEVIRELLRYELSATTRLAFTSQGLTAEFLIPMSRATGS